MGKDQYSYASGGACDKFHRDKPKQLKKYLLYDRFSNVSYRLERSIELDRERFADVENFAGADYRPERPEYYLRRFAVCEEKIKLFPSWEGLGVGFTPPFAKGGWEGFSADIKFFSNKIPPQQFQAVFFSI